MTITFMAVFVIQKDELSKVQQFQNHGHGHPKQIQILFNRNNNRIIINSIRNKEDLSHSILEDFIKKLIKYQEGKHFNQRNKSKMLFNLIYKVKILVVFGNYFCNRARYILSI